ncbi:MAG TPA: hypothetical protein VMY39_04085 [Planctomycetota bacterium]|nr:hypothetical protein [Planctomycetota bacterium]
MTVSFDGPSLRILIDNIADLDAGADIYSEWKEWVKLSDNAKFHPAFDTTGGDPTRPGQTIAPYFFLRNDLGWRIRAPEVNGEVNIVGNMFARDAAVPVQENSVGSFNSLIRLEISPQALVIETTVSASAPDAAHLEVANDGTNLHIGVWLDRLGATVTSPTSATVLWYNPDGTLLFSETDNAPDIRGHFEIDRVQTLLGNTSYYASVSVTDTTGTITSRRGVPTVGP